MCRYAAPDCGPHFSFVLSKEKSPPQRWKRKALSTKLDIERNERVLVTTLTKRMAEELSSYLTKLDINCAYIHSDVDLSLIHI